ncbi:MAG: type II toxin-antitoxin system HicB family antitoxin [Mycobacterium sp.]
MAYLIEVFWGDEDRTRIADVPDLPFCTAHGPTPHDAVAEVELAVEAWLEAARQAGRPIPNHPFGPRVRSARKLRLQLEHSGGIAA